MTFEYKRHFYQLLLNSHLCDPHIAYEMALERSRDCTLTFAGSTALDIINSSAPYITATHPLSSPSASHTCLHASDSVCFNSVSGDPSTPGLPASIATMTQCEMISVIDASTSLSFSILNPLQVLKTQIQDIETKRAEDHKCPICLELAWDPHV